MEKWEYYSQLNGKMKIMPETTKQILHDSTFCGHMLSSLSILPLSIQANQ
jgi:hypothetical protein